MATSTATAGQFLPYTEKLALRTSPMAKWVTCRTSYAVFVRQESVSHLRRARPARRLDSLSGEDLNEWAKLESPRRRKMEDGLGMADRLLR